MTERDLQVSIEQLTAAVRQLTNELQAGRRKEVRTRRVKSVARSRQVREIPVSDVAMAAARRALARAKG